MTSPEKPKFPVKDCGEEIRKEDFVKVIEATREYGNISKSGEFLLQTARGYLQRETDYVWKNAKIAVLGHDLQLVFVSGYQSFQLVVTLDDDDVVNAFCEEKGWKRVSQIPDDDSTSAVVWGDIKGTLTDRVLAMLVKLIKKPSNPNPVIETNGIKRVHVNGLRARKPVNGNIHTESHHFEQKISPNQNVVKVEKKSRKCLILVTASCGLVLLITALILFYVLWLKPNHFTLKL